MEPVGGLTLRPPLGATAIPSVPNSPPDRFAAKSPFPETFQESEQGCPATIEFELAENERVGTVGSGLTATEADAEAEPLT